MFLGKIMSIFLCIEWIQSEIRTCFWWENDEEINKYNLSRYSLILYLVYFSTGFFHKRKQATRMSCVCLFVCLSRHSRVLGKKTVSKPKHWTRHLDMILRYNHVQNCKKCITWLCLYELIYRYNQLWKECTWLDWLEDRSAMEDIFFRLYLFVNDLNYNRDFFFWFCFLFLFVCFWYPLLPFVCFLFVCLFVLFLFFVLVCFSP